MYDKIMVFVPSHMLEAIPRKVADLAPNQRALIPARAFRIDGERRSVVCQYRR